MTASPSTARSAAPSAQLSSWRLAAFAGPQIALAALYTPVFIYLAAFYADARGLPLAAIGALMIAARIVDAVSDPLMGLASDRLSPPLGRRRFWLAASTPFVCVSVWMAFVPPPDADLIYFGGWLIALTLSWTVALTPYFAWGAEIADDYHGRARAAAWREGAFLIGTLAAALLYALAPGAERVEAAPPTAEDGMRTIAIFVVVALPLLTLAALLFAPKPTPHREAAVSDGDGGLFDGLRAMAANPPFRRLIASYFVNSASNALPGALFIFFCAHVLEADQQQTGLLFVLYLVCSVIAAPAWSVLAKRFGKHRVWGVAMIYASVVFAFALTLGPGDIVPFAVIAALTGIAFGADVILPTAMQADVVDVDTARTGVRRTGLYFAAWSVCFKVASGLAAGAAVILLDLADFDATREMQDPSALSALAWLYAGAPIVLKLIAVAMIWRFPLDAEAQAALRREIDRREAAGDV